MEITLNGDPYEVGTPIDEPGDHTLVITGENNYSLTYTFSIELEVNGVADEQSYIGSRTPTFTGGTATLNGEPFTSGTLVEDVGIYDLVITGRPGFSETITFMIDPEINGLSNNQPYQGEVEINIVGQGFLMQLNGDVFSNGVFSTPGIHTLEIFGVGDYLKTITFRVTLVFEGVTNNVDYINTSRTLVFSGGFATLNGVAITSGYVVNEVGNYSLMINGVNFPPAIYNFSIRPRINNLTNGSTYNGFLTPSVLGNNISITLNGVAYTSGTIITNPGLNYIVITSPNGSFQQNIRFTIALYFLGLRDGQTYFETLSPTFSGGTATLNGESFTSGALIDTYGSFELRITGINNFLKVYEFTIKPYQMLKPEDGQSLENFNMVIDDVHTLSAISLNGEVISDNRFLNQIGIYNLLITFQDDVILEIQFIIEPQNYILDGSTFREPVTIDYTNAQVKINGKIQSQKARIDVQGFYDVEVIGINGYFHTFSFEFINPNRTHFQTLIIPMVSIGFASIGMFLLRKRIVK